MAILGSHALDSIFEDLVTELGEAIPETVIEAQRLYVRSAWKDDSWNRGIEDFRSSLSLRGLGYLSEFEGDREQVSLRIANSCLPMLVVGMTQALVEMVYGVDSSEYSWEQSEDGDLAVTIEVR